MAERRAKRRELQVHLEYSFDRLLTQKLVDRKRSAPKRLRLKYIDAAPHVRAAFLMIAAVLLVSHMASGQSLRSRIEEHHRLYVPAGDGTFATVVALPGCSGVSLNSPATDEGRPGDEGDRLFRTHYPKMAERLRDAGFAVFLVDYLSAEGVLNACGDKITLETIAKYITESVALVRESSFVDTSRIHIIGWSMGGRGLLEWLQARTAASSSVHSVVAVYAGCAAANPWNAFLPTLMLLGGADDLASAGVCQDLVAQLPEGHQVSVRVYPGGRHGFDIEAAPPIAEIGGGQMPAYDEEAAREAWHDLVTFLVPVE